MYLSIFSSVVSGADPAEVARKTREFGLRSVQFVPDEVNVGWGFDLNKIASGSFETWADAYQREGVAIDSVAGYLNLLDPNPEKRQKKVETFASFIRRMKILGSRYVSTETGSLSPKGEWTYDPQNSTPEAWEELRRVTDYLVNVAAQEDVVILYEPYIANVLGSPELGAKFVREFNSPHLALVMDPTNWFSSETAKPEYVADILDSGFAAMQGLFKLAHAKDITTPNPGEENPSLPGSGKGILDYPRYIKLLREHGYSDSLVLEHLTEAEIPETMRFVQSFLDQA